MTDFQATMAVLASQDFAGDRTGSQVYVSQDGETLLDVAVGARSCTSTMRTRTLLRWVCCAKPLVLVAFFSVLTDARLDETVRVADTIPEYAAGGKSSVTVADLLTHTVPYHRLGLRWTADGVQDPEKDNRLLTADWDDAVATVCNQTLDGRPGQSVAYTILANWLILGEMIQRLTGRRYEDVVRDRVMGPLGMSSTCLYLDAATTPELAESWVVSEGGAPRRGVLEDPMYRYRRWPGLGAWGPMRELARVLECIAGWRNPALIPAHLRQRMITPLRTELADPVYQGVNIHWSLGCCVDPVSFGLANGTAVVGHTGAHTSLVFSDLDTGVTVAFATSGLMARTADWSRKRRLVHAIYQDLDGLPRRQVQARRASAG
jgi:CubicO group peptidase (beta-lactamase class C family)